MSSYAYCEIKDCGLGLSKPTPYEIMDEVQYCAAGHKNIPNMSVTELIIDLAYRLEEAEAKLERFFDDQK